MARPAQSTLEAWRTGQSSTRAREQASLRAVQGNHLCHQQQWHWESGACVATQPASAWLQLPLRARWPRKPAAIKDADVQNYPPIGIKRFRWLTAWWSSWLTCIWREHRKSSHNNVIWDTWISNVSVFHSWYPNWWLKNSAIQVPNFFFLVISLGLVGGQEAKLLVRFACSSFFLHTFLSLLSIFHMTTWKTWIHR
jgi:hypothetical protein